MPIFSGAPAAADAAGLATALALTGTAALAAGLPDAEAARAAVLGLAAADAGGGLDGAAGALAVPPQAASTRAKSRTGLKSLGYMP